jgi:hypothetical protein
MKKPNNYLLGFIGYTLTMLLAPPLMICGYYIFGIISFMGGLWVIDWNRGGN